MTMALKRFVCSTALALGLTAGMSMVDVTPAYAQCYTAEPLYARDAGGKLVRIGWVLVETPCASSSPAPVMQA